jgi:hypothetical protein
MVSTFGLTADGKYFNPQINQTLTFDHKTQKFTAAADGKQAGDANLNKYRSVCTICTVCTAALLCSWPIALNGSLTVHRIDGPAIV